MNETTIVVKSKDDSGPGIKSAEGRISGLKKTLASVARSAADAGADVGRNIAKGVEKAGPAIAKAAGAAGAAGAGLFAKGFADNMDIAASNAKLQGQLGLTAEQAKKAGDISGKVYRDNFGGSIDEVNDAIRNVSLNLGSLADTSAADIQSMTEKALGLSDAFGVDVAQSTEAAGKLVKNGLAANATEAFDIITAGFQSGADRSGDFLDTLNEYSPQFAKLGISGTQALGILQDGLKAGARDTDGIADAFKEFSLRAIDGSALTAQGFKAAGLDAKEMAKQIAAGGPTAAKATETTLKAIQSIKDPVKQNQAGVALFGTQWEDTLRQILPAVSSMNDAADTVTGSTDRMTAAIGDTGKAKIETAKRAFEGWTQEMAGAEGPMGTVSAAVVAFAGPALAMAGQLGSLATGLAAVNTASIMSAASTVKDTAVKVVNTTATYAASAASKAWAAAQWLLNAALSMNPIGLVIIAIIALVAAIVYAYRHSEKFRAIVTVALRAVAAAWDWLKGKIGAAVEWIKVKATQLLVAWLNFPGRMRAGFAKVFNYLIQPFDSAVQWIRSKLGQLMDYVAGIPGRIKNTLSGAVSSIGGFLPGFAHGGIIGASHAATGGARGGLVEVGEHGRELVRLPYGSQVIPNGKTEDMLSGRGGGGRSVLEIRGDGSRLADFLLELLRKAIRERGGNVQLVLGRS